MSSKDNISNIQNKFQANPEIFQKLETVIRKLRDPNGGCPWDLEQNHKSLAPYAMEETAELLEAIELENDALLKEELGDVLFQVMIHSEIARAENRFDINDVVQEIHDKLVRRHPHVFGDVNNVNNADQVIAQWQEIKKTEKQNKAKSVIDIPIELPALQRAAKIGSKCEKFGFDWESSAQVWDKFNEEVSELKEAEQSKNIEHMEEELGDLLFVCAQLARKWKIDPESALRRANLKFLNRFEKMYELAKSQGQSLEDLNLDQQEKLWQQIKKKIEL